MVSAMVEVQPRALIVTVYGLYARDHGGWLPVAGLVRALARLGVDEPAVRSAISRLKRRELLAPARRGGIAGYELTTAGGEILREGDERNFAPAPGGGGWLLAVFSVPEAERAKRHTLRSRLSALGFGSAAPGVWVAPAHRYDAARALLVRLGLASYVDLFRADYLAFGDLAGVIKNWWDLDAIRAGYDDFIARWERCASGESEFATWVRAVTDWRRLPYLDPGLPADLLPPDWPGARAASLFAELRAGHAGPATEQAEALLYGSTA